MEDVAQAVVRAGEVAELRERGAVRRRKPLEGVQQHAVKAQRLHLRREARHVVRRGFLHERPIVEAVLVVVVPQPEVGRSREIAEAWIRLRLFGERAHAPLPFAPGAVGRRDGAEGRAEEETQPPVVAPAPRGGTPGNAGPVRRVRPAHERGVEAVLHARHREDAAAPHAEEAHRGAHAVGEVVARAVEAHGRVRDGVGDALAERQDQVVARLRLPAGGVVERTGHPPVGGRRKGERERPLRVARPDGPHRAVRRREFQFHTVLRPGQHRRRRGARRAERRAAERRRDVPAVGRPGNGAERPRRRREGQKKRRRAAASKRPFHFVRFFPFHSIRPFRCGGRGRGGRAARPRGG